MTEELNTQATSDVIENLQEIRALNKNRIKTYALLARIFRKEVDQTFIDELRKMKFPVYSGNKDLDEGNYRFARFLSNIWPNSIVDLAVEYNHVFIGGNTDSYSAAYPYESVYTSEWRLLMQEARDEVLHIYHANNLGRADNFKEYEDHICVELEFVQVLAERADRALLNSDEDEAFELFTKQNEFLHEHLLNWVGMFTADVRKFAKNDLYKGAAAFLDGFLETDREFLNDLTGYEEPY
jgi:putative dimethyl sulfoxide reductase chaperone